MRNIVVFLLLINLNLYAQKHEIIGVLNSTDTDRSFGEGQEAIKASILDSLGNLNLFEYSHSLNELYGLLADERIKTIDWNNYIENLLYEVRLEKAGAMSPFYAIDYKGIIPLQAEFFVSSLDLNTTLKEQHPAEYENLRSSTSKLIGHGYSWEAIDTLLTIYTQISTIGTVNFWYFLQVYGCPIIELGMTKEKAGSADIEYMLRNLRKTSTYKTPLRLQTRKYWSLKQKLSPCLNIYNMELKGKTVINDKYGKAYFEEALKDGVDRNKTKQF